MNEQQRFLDHLCALLTHIEDMVDSAPETVRLWNNVTKALALSKDRIANEPATVLRLRELLRVVADEPNIDKARALADAELKTPNVADKRRAEGESA